MRTIPLTKGYVAVVDDEDADLLDYRYWASVTGERHVYAQRHHSTPRPGLPKLRGKRHLHRDVAERIHGGPIPKGFDVDHINHDTLDCRRANLRVVPHRVNIWNQNGAGRDSQSGIRGVRQKNGRWAAYICEGRKMHSLGTYDTLDEARAARLRAEAARLEAHAA